MSLISYKLKFIQKLGLKDSTSLADEPQLINQGLGRDEINQALSLVLTQLTNSSTAFTDTSSRTSMLLF